MASMALEEKINKIRLKNEEIKRRYEEVEADKKRAEKLDASREPIPSEDWPERKEPPEFFGSFGKHAGKAKHTVRRHNDPPAQYYTGSGDGKKTFADGQGPPPDPKYNFLADSERDERANEIPKDSERNRGRNKSSRGGFGRRGGDRDWHAKDNWNRHENPGNMTHSEYEAWRAERNRIDEARISRQRTAEGNWRREWDNDKMHLADDVTKRESRVTLGDAVTRQEHSDNEKYYRSPRAAARISHQTDARESHQAFAFSEPAKTSHGNFIDNEKRLVITTEKSIKVLLNPQQGSTPLKSPVMSVKVSSPNIAGTGRVGPRQRPRVTYSNQSEGDSTTTTTTRQKSSDESTRIRSFDHTARITSPKSPRQRRKSEEKNSYPARKQDNAEGMIKFSRWDSQKLPNHSPKSPRAYGRFAESFDNDSTKIAESQTKNILDDSLPEEITRDSNDLSCNELESSAVDDKSNDSLGPVENKNDENENARCAIQALPEFTENNSVALTRAQLEGSASPTVENYAETLGNFFTDRSPRNDNEEKFDPEIGNDGAKYNDSLDDVVEFTENKAINCSVDSGMTSNDSGFNELSSNDGIHDITVNADLKKNEIDDDCSEEARPSTSQAGQSCSIIEIHETQRSNDANNEKSIVESSFNDSEITVDNSQAQIPEEIFVKSDDEANNAGSDETIESESRFKEIATIDNSAEIPEIMKKSREPCNHEASIDSTSPRDREDVK